MSVVVLVEKDQQACLENGVAEAVEGHHEQFSPLSAMMLTRAMAGRALCACRAVV